MKTQLVIYPAMFVMLFAACGENKDNVTEQSIEAQNEMSGEMHEDDTAMVKRDGTLLDGAIERIDSVSLPSPVINTIEAESALSQENIVHTRRFTENGLNYYEIKFSVKDGEPQTVIFDENGKIRPKN